MLTPIALMKALLPAMIQQGWGRVVNIIKKSVKAPVSVLGLLTGFMWPEPQGRWQIPALQSTICNLQCITPIAACAFLCSQHAGFIVGQNILLDGGEVNATM